MEEFEEIVLDEPMLEQWWNQELIPKVEAMDTVEQLERYFSLLYKQIYLHRNHLNRNELMKRLQEIQ